MTITLTNDNDSYRWFEENDFEGQPGDIAGLGGDDTIVGDIGDDYLDGGDGNDKLDYILNTDDGNDTLVGGAGDDTIFGGDGDDDLRTGSGKAS